MVKTKLVPNDNMKIDTTNIASNEKNEYRNR